MLFSFVIPIYNAEQTLERCLSSVFAQTYCKFEVIAIDDGSSDMSYKILQKYANQDARYKIYTQSNMGPGPTRNRGLNIAKGDYVAFLDSDDYIENDYLDKVLKIISKDSPDVIMLDLVLESPNGKIIRYERASIYSDLSKKELIAMQMTGKLPWGGCRKVVSLDLIRKNSLKYSVDAVGEEAIFSFDVLRLSSKIEFLNSIVYHYIDHPTSQSKKGMDNPWGQIVKNLEGHLKKNGLYEEYGAEHNSFKITSLCVSLYRVSINYPFKMARKRIQNSLNNSSDFDIPYYEKSLDFKTKIILLLAKCNFVSIIIILSKIKFKLSKR